MLAYLLVLLILLWFIGVVRFPVLSIVNSPIIYIGRRAVGLYDILVFILILWLIRILPSPLREIVTVFLILWLLSFFGVFLFAGLSNILVLLLIIGLIFYL